MQHILSSYDPITLEQMGGIRLMNRTDTKFVTTDAKLRQLLLAAGDDYYVQDIDGVRLSSYYTLYFDTPRCDMFRAHHNGKLNRQKVRIRAYEDAGAAFLEVKTKNNHGRTKKRRVEAESFDGATSDKRYIATACEGIAVDWRAFLAEYLRYPYDDITGRIENRFRRITLVNKGLTERLTIDTSVAFRNLVTGHRLSLDGVAIIELKRDGLVASPILEHLRRLRIMPMGFSKYCMGMALTDDSLRRNRFLPRITAISKIMGAGAVQPKGCPLT